MADTIQTGSATIVFARGLAGKAKRRFVSGASVWEKFTIAERETIAGSGTNKAKAFMWTLSLLPEMKKAAMKNALQRLEDASLLETGRAQAIIDAIR